MGQSILQEFTTDHCKVDGYEFQAQADKDGKYSLLLSVGGAHCAACIERIETAVKKTDGVTNARLNFSTGKLSVSWVGQPTIANLIAANVHDLGYTVNPYNLSNYNADMDREEKFLLLCLGVAGFAMGNIMLLSVGLWTTNAETMGVMTRDLLHWVSALIAIPTIIFSGRPFFRSAFSALKAGHTNMDVPISVGLILTGGMSLVETINKGEHAYFDSAVMLIFFLLIGRYLDFRVRKHARSGAQELLSSMQGFAKVLDNGTVRSVPIHQIQIGSNIIVAAGEKFPVDGRITEGVTDVDVSIATGESIPENVNVGSIVYGGTLNLSAPVIMIAEKPAKDSLIADIAKLMDQASQGQARYVRLAEKVARLYTPVVHALALLTFLSWTFIGHMAWQESLLIAITVLIITCPCALGLAVPVVQMMATGKLMKQGILVKSGDALERLAAIDTILMDKTGTVTLGRPELISTPPQESLQIACALASHSKHPLSLALMHAYQGPLLKLENVSEHPGLGLEGLWNGTPVKLGNRTWCHVQSQEQSPYIELWLKVGDAPATPFYFSDKLRPDAPETISKLLAQNLNIEIVSGDRSAIVETVAQMCHIKNFKSNTKPQDKYDYMRQLRQQNHTILMVGDGLNDAPIIAGANVSMAPGNAISITQNAADIIFMGDKLFPVLQAYHTAKTTNQLIFQNFGLAILYNAIAIPMAMLGMITPLVAALAMSGSSIIVVLNSLRLKVIK